MQLKALAALISVALTLGVEAVPSSFDPGAGVKGHLKRSASHGVGHGVGVDLAKRATALVAKKRLLERHGTRDADDKGCKGKNATDDTTPAADKPATDKPADTNTTNTPTPKHALALTLPTTTPTTNDNNGGSGTNNTNSNNNSGAKDDKTLWLDAHNFWRGEHNASALTWSDDLANAAANWANRCRWVHSAGEVGQYGENMAANQADLDIAGSVQDWVSEIKDYDPHDPQYSHFTQVVWKATTQLGCAIADCSPLEGMDSEALYKFGVCEYNPPGNVDGEFGDNVQIDFKKTN